MAWQQCWNSKGRSSAGSWELGAGRISGRSDCDDRRDELIVLGEGGEGGDERRGEGRREGGATAIAIAIELIRSELTVWQAVV